MMSVSQIFAKRVRIWQRHLGCHGQGTYKAQISRLLSKPFSAVFAEIQITINDSDNVDLHLLQDFSQDFSDNLA